MAVIPSSDESEYSPLSSSSSVSDREVRSTLPKLAPSLPPFFLTSAAHKSSLYFMANSFVLANGFAALVSAHTAALSSSVRDKEFFQGKG